MTIVPKSKSERASVWKGDCPQHPIRYSSWLRLVVLILSQWILADGIMSTGWSQRRLFFFFADYVSVTILANMTNILYIFLWVSNCSFKTWTKLAFLPMVILRATLHILRHVKPPPLSSYLLLTYKMTSSSQGRYSFAGHVCL